MTTIGFLVALLGLIAQDTLVIWVGVIEMAIGVLILVRAIRD